jgi:hypothetical protein
MLNFGKPAQLSPASVIHRAPDLVKGEAGISLAAAGPDACLFQPAGKCRDGVAKMETPKMQATI